PILPLLFELPVEPRRRDLQLVPAIDHRGGVEHVSELPAQALALADSHTSGLVDVEPEHPPGPEPSPLHVDELQPVAAHHRGNRLLDQGRSLRVIHHSFIGAPRRAGAPPPPPPPHPPPPQPKKKTNTHLFTENHE